MTDIERRIAAVLYEDMHGHMSNDIAWFIAQERLAPRIRQLAEAFAHEDEYGFANDEAWDRALQEMEGKNVTD